MIWGTRVARGCALALGAGLISFASAQQAPGGGEAPAAGAAAAAPENAEPFLRSLERADENIRTLSARVRYDRLFKLEGGRHLREGMLYFRQGPGANAKRDRAFGVHFDTLYIDDRKQEDEQVVIFDGRWLVEMRPREKQMTRREVARPGDTFDPLKVGEGPMPLPIGQKADDILAKYIAEALAPEDGLTPEQRSGLEAVLGKWVQVRLLPRPTALMPGQKRDRDEFKEIRLWYERDTLLPRMAKTVSRGLDEAFVVLTGLKVNEPLPAGALSTEPPAEGRGWQVQVENLPPPNAPEAGRPAGG